MASPIDLPHTAPRLVWVGDGTAQRQAIVSPAAFHLLRRKSLPVALELAGTRRDIYYRPDIYTAGIDNFRTIL